MNKENNIDQLFSDKLHQAEVTPSKAAWDKLEGNLAGQNRKKAGIWLKVAAAVLILIVAALSLKFYLDEENGQSKFANASEEFLNAPYPIQTELAGIYLDDVLADYEENLAAQQKVKKNIFTVQPSATVDHLTSKSNKQKSKTNTQLIAMEDNNKQSQTSTGNPTKVTDVVAVAEVTSDASTNNLVIDKVISKSMIEHIEPLNTVAINDEALPKVTITYRSSTEKAEKEKGKFSIKKVFNSAKKLANGELMADLREAKDGFISSGFKSLND